MRTYTVSYSDEKGGHAERTFTDRDEAIRAWQDVATQYDEYAAGFPVADAEAFEFAGWYWDDLVQFNASVNFYTDETGNGTILLSFLAMPGEGDLPEIPWEIAGEISADQVSRAPESMATGYAVRVNSTREGSGYIEATTGAIDAFSECDLYRII